MKLRAILALCLCLAAQQVRAEDLGMPGNWFGVYRMDLPKTDEKGTIHTFGRFRADGTYDVTSAAYAACRRITGGLQNGKWVVEDGYLKLYIDEATVKANGRRYFEYRILEHSETDLKYLNEENGRTFTFRRVPSDFQIPACGAEEP